MTFTDSGIILIRKDTRENDRMASVYTAAHGRVNLRFPGVNRPKAKLRAMSELFACADYRMYFRSGATVGCATGGKLSSVFPAVRADLNRTRLALHFCEVLFRLTPLHQPSQEKYNLMLEALTALDSGAGTACIRAAFVLRLMRAAGYGVEKPVLGIDGAFWQGLHEEPLASVSSMFSSRTEEDLARAEYVLDRFFASNVDFKIKTAEGLPAAGRS